MSRRGTILRRTLASLLLTLAAAKVPSPVRGDDTISSMGFFRMIEGVDLANTDESQHSLPWSEPKEDGDAVFQDLLMTVWETREGSIVYGGPGGLYFNDAGLQATI